jgi:hypothetical protein
MSQRLLTFGLLLVLGPTLGLGTATGQTNFQVDWERSLADDGTLPPYMSNSFDNTYHRGFAYGRVNDGNGGSDERLLVPTSRAVDPDDLAISVVDASTGDEVGELTLDVGNTIPDRDWALRDVAVTDDGQVVACNLTLNDEGPGGAANDYFRCYRWTHEQAGPEELTFSGSTGYCDGDGTADRLGVFTAAGSFSDDSLTLWVAEQQGSHVHRFDWTGSSFQPVAMRLTDGTGVEVVMEGYPKVAPKGPGASGFYANSGTDPINGTDGTPAYEFGARGVLQRDLGSMELDASTDAIASFTHDGDEYLLAHQHGSNGRPDATLVNVNNGTEYGVTTNLSGDDDSRPEGDVAIRDNGDGHYTAFVFTSQEGLGAYTTTTAPLPVELASFGVEADGKRAILSWQTASEANNAGFEVQHRGPDASGFSSLGFVESNAPGGTATQAQSYRFATESLSGGRHTFRLRQLDTDGSATLTETRTVTIQREDGLTISGPNPIGRGQSLSVLVNVMTSQVVDVALYDVLGRRVQTVGKGEVQPGQPLRTRLSTDNLSSGVYLLRANGASLVESRTVTIVK